MKTQDQEQRAIRVVCVDGKADIQGAAQVLALHFTQGDPMAYVRRAMERAQERKTEEELRG